MITIAPPARAARPAPTKPTSKERPLVRRQNTNTQDLVVAGTTDRVVVKPLPALKTPALKLPLKEHLPNMWQSLVYASVSQGLNDFSRATFSMFPGSSEAVVNHLFDAKTHETLTFVPRAMEAIQTLRKIGSGPLVALPLHKQCAALQTKEQFEVRVPKDRARVLDALDRTFGSALYFHGSPTPYWAQIFDQGLEPKSHTRMQVNGANRGSGVYVATVSSLSAQFTQQHHDKVVLGIVQVIHNGRIISDREAYVVPDRAFLQLRYIAVYPNIKDIPDIGQKELVWPEESAAA